MSALSVLLKYTPSTTIYYSWAHIYAVKIGKQIMKIHIKDVAEVPPGEEGGRRLALQSSEKNPPLSVLMIPFVCILNT